MRSIFFREQFYWHSLAFGYKISFLRSRWEGSRAKETNSRVDTIYYSYLHKQETWHKCAGPRKIRNLCYTMAVRAFEPLNGTFRREQNNKGVKKVSAWKLPWNENYVARRSVRELYIITLQKPGVKNRVPTFRVFNMEYHF